MRIGFITSLFALVLAGCNPPSDDVSDKMFGDQIVEAVDVSQPKILVLPDCSVDDLDCVWARLVSPCYGDTSFYSDDSFCDPSRQAEFETPSPYATSHVIASTIVQNGDTRDANLQFYLSDSACSDSMNVALKGWTASGEPMVATEAGVITIKAPMMDTFIWGRQVIDRETGTLVERYLVPNDQISYGYHFKPSGEVYMSAETGCYSAIGASGQVLGTVGYDNCADARRSGEMYEEHPDTGLEPATAADVEIARKAVGELATFYGDRFADRVFRIVGRDELVVNSFDTCT